MARIIVAKLIVWIGIGVFLVLIWCGVFVLAKLVLVLTH